MIKSKITVIILIIFGIATLLKEAGSFLVINENPVKADIIIVLSGGGIERLDKGVQLYRDGYAPYFMISNGQEDNLFQAALIKGVPLNSVMLENKARSTLENAIYTIDIMTKHKLKSALIVSSNFHMRRVKMNFAKAVKDKEITLWYISADDLQYQPSQWWATKEDRRTTFIEYVKMVGNFFGYHGSEAKNLMLKLTKYLNEHP